MLTCHPIVTVPPTTPPPNHPSSPLHSAPRSNRALITPSPLPTPPPLMAFLSTLTPNPHLAYNKFLLTPFSSATPLSTSLGQNRHDSLGTSHTLDRAFQILTKNRPHIHSLGLYEMTFALNPEYPNYDVTRPWTDWPGTRRADATPGIPLHATMVFLPLHTGPSDAGHFSLATRVPNPAPSHPQCPYRILYHCSMNWAPPSHLLLLIRRLLRTHPDTPILCLHTPHQTEQECLPRALFAAVMLASFPASTTLPWERYLRPSNPVRTAHAVRTLLHHVLTTNTCPLLRSTATPSLPPEG